MIIRIATPLPNDVDATKEQLVSIKNLISQGKKYNFEHIEIHSAIISNNRNLLVNYNNMNFDKILFVDGDITFKLEDFEKLMNSGLPIISGKYYLRDNTLSYWNYGEKEQKLYPETTAELIEVENTGLGFCLIDKIVFEKLNKMGYRNYFPYYESKFENLYLGEDIGFCRVCSCISMPIYVHNDIFVNHIIKQRENNG